MSWSPQQIKLLHIIKTRLGWDRPKYEMLLRNIAGIRAEARTSVRDGVEVEVISSKNRSATNAGYERLLAFAEQEGFEDAQHGPGYWTKKAREECSRQHRKILALVDLGQTNHLFDTADPLPGFIEHQTQDREGGPTRNLAECGPVESYKILEGLKRWLWSLAKKRSITIDLHTGI